MRIRINFVIALSAWFNDKQTKCWKNHFENWFCNSCPIWGLVFTVGWILRLLPTLINGCWYGVWITNESKHGRLLAYRTPARCIVCHTRHRISTIICVCNVRTTVSNTTINPCTQLPIFNISESSPLFYRFASQSLMSSALQQQPGTSSLSLYLLIGLPLAFQLLWMCFHCVPWPSHVLLLMALAAFCISSHSNTSPFIVTIPSPLHYYLLIWYWYMYNLAIPGAPDGIHCLLSSSYSSPPL